MRAKARHNDATMSSLQTRLARLRRRVTSGADARAYGARRWVWGLGLLAACAVAAFALIANSPIAHAGESPIPGPPNIGNLNVETGATRAHFYDNIEPRHADTHWQIEYAVPGGAWTVAGSGVVKGNPYKAGEQDSTVVETNTYGLTPATTYEARFVAENSYGTATSNVSHFTTAPVGPPKLVESNCESNYVIGEGGICANEATHTKSIEFQSFIEAEAAETQYRFEYSTEANGGYKVAPEGTGTISVAEDHKFVRVHVEGLAPLGVHTI